MSVIVPVWNVAPWLDECLTSVEAQTIGTSALELIVVDDGSTDGSGDQCDAFAEGRSWVSVIHQANSGGPGGPRNVGLNRARGRYVFFLDADDYLGTEALDRLVAMAERNRSDIVLGHMVEIGGRTIRQQRGLFRHDRDVVSADLVARSGNVLKLFRRSMLRRANLRFEPGVAGGEDGDFMARAYLEARVISVVADYECYHVRRRPGSQTSRTDRHDDLVEYIGRLERLRILPTVARRRPGGGRDRLLSKPFCKMAAKFRGAWRRRDPDERRRVFEAAAAVVTRWYGPGVERQLPQLTRLTLHCIAEGRLRELEDIVTVPRRRPYRTAIVDRGRIFARFPHFRDGSGIPDRYFDITPEVQPQVRLDRADLVDGRLTLEGIAYLRLLGGEAAVELRRRPIGRPVRLPTESVATPLVHDRYIHYPAAGFRSGVDVGGVDGTAAVPEGTWVLGVACEADGIRRGAPLLAVGRAVPRTLAVLARDERASLWVGPDGVMRLSVGREPGTDLIDRLERAARAGSRVARAGSRAARRMPRTARGHLRGRPATRRERARRVRVPG